MQSLDPWSSHQRATFLSASWDDATRADLVELTLQVTRAGFLQRSQGKFSPQPLLDLIAQISNLGSLDDDPYLAGQVAYVLDLIASGARAQSVRAAAAAAGGAVTESIPEDDLDDAGWAVEDYVVLNHCKRIVADDDRGLELRPGYRVGLLLAITRVYDRGHSSASRKLVKSGGLTRAIRLLSSELLFPPTPDGSTVMIAERVRLLCSICVDSPQRPVADAAGLVLLEQDLEESWSTRSPDLTPWALEAATSSREHVLSLTELARHLDPPSAEPLYELLRHADFKYKRMRLAELSAVLDTHGDTPGVEVIAQHALGAIFENLSEDLKGRLIERLFKSLERSNARSRRGWLKYVLEPIVLQNATNLSVQTRLVSLVSGFDPDAREPYLLFHLDAMREVDITRSDPEAIVFASEHGSRAFVPRLYPLTEVKGLFGRQTSLGRAAREAIDVIVEREGLGATSGSLSVAQGVGGELSVAVARRGALSLGASSGPSNGATGEGGALDVSSSVAIGEAAPATSAAFKVVVVLGLIAALYLVSAGVLAMLGAP